MNKTCVCLQDHSTGHNLKCYFTKSLLIKKSNVAKSWLVHWSTWLNPVQTREKSMGKYRNLSSEITNAFAQRLCVDVFAHKEQMRKCVLRVFYQDQTRGTWRTEQLSWNCENQIPETGMNCSHFLNGSQSIKVSALHSRDRCNAWILPWGKVQVHWARSLIHSFST